MNNVTNTKESLWKFGKREYKKFLAVNIKKSTDYSSIFIGIFLTALVILPLTFILFIFFQMYFFHIRAIMLFLMAAWILLMFCNGLSCFISVKYIQYKFSDNTELKSVNANAIWFSQTFSIGFGIFSLCIIIFLWITTL